MALQKWTETSTSFLTTSYTDAIKEHGGAALVTIEFNRAFLAKMKATEALGDYTPNQMRAKLQSEGVYVATEPRAEPKKKGKCKADLVGEVNALLDPLSIAGGMKLTMADLEVLIQALTQLHSFGDAEESEGETPTEE